MIVTITKASRTLKIGGEKSSRIKPVGFQEEYFNNLRLPFHEVFIYLFSEGKKSSGKLALS